MSNSKAVTVALVGIMIALVAVVTLLVRVPIPATQGYFNFSDVVIYFVAFSFGPWVGAAAGGIGPGLADLLGGYAQYAPITLIAHGLQGLAAGAIARDRGWPGLLLGWLVGSLAMVVVYLLGEIVLYGLGAALVEVPPNLLQNLGGGLLGIPLYYAVRRAYPPITRWGRAQTWRED